MWQFSVVYRRSSVQEYPREPSPDSRARSGWTSNKYSSYCNWIVIYRNFRSFSASCLYDRISNYIRYI